MIRRCCSEWHSNYIQGKCTVSPKACDPIELLRDLLFCSQHSTTLTAGTGYLQSSVQRRRQSFPCRCTLTKVTSYDVDDAPLCLDSKSGKYLQGVGQGVEIHGEFSGSIDISLVGSGRRLERGYSELQRCHCCLMGSEWIYISFNIKILVLQIELRYCGFRYEKQLKRFSSQQKPSAAYFACQYCSEFHWTPLLLLIRLPVVQNVPEVFCVAVAH